MHLVISGHFVNMLQILQFRKNKRIILFHSEIVLENDIT